MDVFILFIFHIETYHAVLKQNASGQTPVKIARGDKMLAILWETEVKMLAILWDREVKMLAILWDTEVKMLILSKHLIYRADGQVN